MKKDKQRDPLPLEFSSYEEAAEFWDTHDTTDYSEDFEDIDIDAKFLGRHFEIEIDEDVMLELKNRAQKLGVPLKRLASDLLRQQLLEAA